MWWKLESEVDVEKVGHVGIPGKLHLILAAVTFFASLVPCEQALAIICLGVLPYHKDKQQIH